MNELEKEIKSFLESIIKEVGFKNFKMKEVNVVYSPKPHEKPKALDEKAKEVAIYMFKYGDVYLKIGKVGEKSSQRFINHHYNPNSCSSNLARQLINDTENDYGKEWNDIKENYIKSEKYRNNKNKEEYKKYREAREKIGKWIMKNTSRINIYLKLSDENYIQYKYFILNLFESALQCKYKPRYENNYMK